MSARSDEVELVDVDTGYPYTCHTYARLSDFRASVVYIGLTSVSRKYQRFGTKLQITDVAPDPVFGTEDTLRIRRR